MPARAKILRHLAASISLALANTLQNRKRLAAAIAGISFSLLLIFMQLGFLRCARVASTLFYNYVDFDIVIVSDKYRSFTSAGTFDKARLLQANITPGVAASSVMNVKLAKWEDPKQDDACSLLVIGLDMDPDFITNPIILEGLPTIKKRDQVMIDTLSHRDYGDISVGREAQINGVDIKVASQLTLGTVLFSEGGVVVNNDTFTHVTGVASRNVSFGMIKASPGISPDALRDRLEADLPEDVFVFTRAELLPQEQEYFISVKPVGIMFRSGVTVAFMVGMVILYQVMSTEIINRLTEYATMKAMGFPVHFIYMTGLMQAIFYSLFSFFPTLLLSFFLFRLVHWASKMPMDLNLRLCVEVFSLGMLMCCVSGFLALRKVKTADPAELF